MQKSQTNPNPIQWSTFLTNKINTSKTHFLPSSSKPLYRIRELTHSYSSYQQNQDQQDQLEAKRFLRPYKDLRNNRPRNISFHFVISGLLVHPIFIALHRNKDFGVDLDYFIQSLGLIRLRSNVTVLVKLIHSALLLVLQLPWLKRTNRSSCFVSKFQRSQHIFFNFLTVLAITAITIKLPTPLHWFLDPLFLRRPKSGL